MNKFSIPGAIIAIIAITCIALPAAAKRIAPKPVSIVHQGVRYEAVHFGSDRGNRIQAIDIKTDEKLWDLVIYEVKLDPNLERDVQDVFINSMKIEGDKLHLTNESQEEFVVDLSKRRLISRKIKVPGAYACSEDADCTTTCAQGAINKTWHEKNNKSLATCKDGCSRQGTRPARCIAGACTRIGRDNKPDLSCTRKLIWEIMP